MKGEGVVIAEGMTRSRYFTLLRTLLDSLVLAGLLRGRFADTLLANTGLSSVVSHK